MHNKIKIRSLTKNDKQSKDTTVIRSYDKNNHNLTFQKINQILSNTQDLEMTNNLQNQIKNSDSKTLETQQQYSERCNRKISVQNDQYEDENQPEEIRRFRSLTSNNLLQQSERNGQQFKTKWDKINKQNTLYFDHLKGDCKCTKCKCTRCRCNIRVLQYESKKDPKTEYQSKLGEKQIEFQQMFTPDQYQLAANNDEKNMEIYSTAQKSYDHKIAKNPIDEVVQVNRNSLICGYQSLDQNTSYGKNFQAKVNPRGVKYSPLEQSLVPHSLKMDLKTESMKLTGRQNKNDYNIINFAYERDKKLRPPVGVNIPMFSNTWYRTSNQNWFKNDNFDQLAFNKENFRIKNSHISENKLISENHFQSTAQKDYIQKPVEYCDQVPKSTDNTNRLTRRAYMYRLYNETKGKFS